MVVVRWQGHDGKNLLWGSNSYICEFEEYAIMECIEENNDLLWFKIEDVEYESHDSKNS